jgi:nickel-dependent lactate racemase
VVRIVTGHAVDAWKEGTRTFAAMNFAQITERADAAFVSAGGFPKDINMYQAHKVLEMSSRSVRDGGVLVLFAELAEGYGHPVFEAWAKKGLTPEEVIPAFEAEFCFGGHKLFYLGKLAQRLHILLCSSLSEEVTRSMYCEKTASPEAALQEVRRRLGGDFKAYVIPQGGIVLPVPADGEIR